MEYPGGIIGIRILFPGSFAGEGTKKYESLVAGKSVFGHEAERFLRAESDHTGTASRLPLVRRLQANSRDSKAAASDRGIFRRNQ